MATKDSDSDVSEFPFPYLSEYFKLDGTQSKENMSVKCKLCLGNKFLKSAWSTASNLRKHIQRIHPTKVSEMEQFQKQGKKRAPDLEIESTGARKKQSTLAFANNTISQGTVDKLIIDFVCNSIQPFSIVEEESFVNLIKGLAPNRVVMCRRTVAARLKERYDNQKKKLIGELSKVNAVSTTADCWTHFNRAFLGVTVHWIDKETLERKSAMLTVQRLVGRHTYDVLAATIEGIHRDFNIQNKVVSCVTDNGSNFIKAFTMFGMKPNEDEVEADDESEEVAFIEVAPILDEGVNEFQYILPPHQRCAAHTLNLVAVKDSQKAEDDTTFKKIARSTFARCQALWNKQRSTVVADSIRMAFQKLLVTPNATRWLSTYDSVKCLVSAMQKCGPDALDGLMDSIGLARFRPVDVTFLNEYIAVMKPVAVALNILQAEKNMYIGYLLPTIKCLIRELSKKTNDRSLSYCRPLAKALMEGVQKRFGSIMEDRKLTIAAGLIPALKFSWLEGQQKEEAISFLKEEVVTTCGVETGETLPEETEETSLESDEEAMFFNTATSAAAVSPVLDETISYLSSSSTEVKLLVQYPSLKRLFLKVNAGIPSSAPVERLFSVCKEVLSPKRARLSDENFKMQLFCKVNRNL